MFRYEIRLAGTGGQGLILAGIVLAEAAVAEGHNAAQTQSYGPESRGGASKAEVIIAEGEIDYPKVTKPDFLLVMSQPAADLYGGKLREGGLILVDSTFVADFTAGPGRVVRLPLTALARQELGRDLVANIVALGALVTLAGVVRRESLEQAVLRRVPKGTEGLNRKALEVGVAAARGTL